MKTLTITEDKVRKAAEECPTVKKTMEILFPKVFALTDFSVEVTDTSLLCVRSAGNLRAKGYYLSSCYNWAIVKDNLGDLVLLPTRK